VRVIKEKLGRSKKFNRTVVINEYEKRTHFTVFAEVPFMEGKKKKLPDLLVCQRNESNNNKFTTLLSKTATL
jgi:hypothetical protein